MNIQVKVKPNTKTRGLFSFCIRPPHWETLRSITLHKRHVKRSPQASIRRSTQQFAGIILCAIPFYATPSRAEFQQIATEDIRPCHIRLTRIPTIPYQCWEFSDPDATLPVWKQSLGFEFGKLSRAQWEQIAIAYAGWRDETITARNSTTLPPYDPDHHYWLMDFMPPIMQATNRHRFRQEKHPVLRPPNPTPVDATVLANCWGTLYEILRLKNTSFETPTYLMMIDAQTMLRTLKATSTPTQDPQPGDFLLISHDHMGQQQKQTYLDHAALFIDNNLVFEKAGAGDTVPYRLIGLSTLQRIWRRDIYSYQIRRPVDNLILPHPLSFGDRHHSDNTWTSTHPRAGESSSPQIFSILPLPQLIQTGNRFTLPPQTYRSNFYQMGNLGAP